MFLKALKKHYFTGYFTVRRISRLICYSDAGNPWKCQKFGDIVDNSTGPFFAVPVLIVIYLLFVGVVAILAQMVLPNMFPLLDVMGLGSALVPLVVIYASLELGDERGPILAATLGFLLDLAIPGSKLGTSVLILSAISALITTQAAKPESHTWIFRLAFVVVGTFLFFVLTHTLRLVEAARWYWPFAVWSKIVFGTMLNMILGPIFFYLVGLPPRALGWEPKYERHDPYGHAR
jgi:cell shape-determining protein MreD